VREEVEKVDHAQNCASSKQVCLTCGQEYGYHYGENCASSQELDQWKPSPVPKECDCWKSRVLALIDQAGKQTCQHDDPEPGTDCVDCAPATNVETK
jgi:hypothetical protein